MEKNYIRGCCGTVSWGNQAGSRVRQEIPKTVRPTGQGLQVGCSGGHWGQAEQRQGEAAGEEDSRKTAQLFLSSFFASLCIHRRLGTGERGKKGAEGVGMSFS